MDNSLEKRLGTVRMGHDWIVIDNDIYLSVKIYPKKLGLFVIDKLNGIKEINLPRKCYRFYFYPFENSSSRLLKLFSRVKSCLK